ELSSPSIVDWSRSRSYEPTACSQWRRPKYHDIRRYSEACLGLDRFEQPTRTENRGLARLLSRLHARGPCDIPLPKSKESNRKSFLCDPESGYVLRECRAGGDHREILEHGILYHRASGNHIVRPMRTA